MNRFIGRDAESEELRQAIAAGAQVITICGPAGMGKTRLAQEALPDDSVFVDLTNAASSGDIERALGVALGVAQTFGDRSEHVARVLAARGKIVVVLDNFEHLVTHAPVTIEAWRRAAPEAKLVVTSRERLGLRKELVIELGPLELDRGAGPGVQLLIERARECDESFALADGELSLVTSIAEELDGIPLALELAGPQLAARGPRGLLEKLGNRFEALKDSADSMRAAVEWSWDLLNASEREAFSQCGVFRGGFTFEAVDRVVELADESVLDVLQSLHQKSLIRPAVRGRMGMYLVLRDFASERLESEQSVFARHAAYYAELGERLVSRLESSDAAQAWADLKAERDNLIAAADQTSEPRTRARVLLSLARLWSIERPTPEEEARLDRAVKECPSHAGELLCQRAFFAFERSELESATRDFSEAWNLAQRSKDQALAATSARGLARAAMARGETRQAFELFEQAIDSARLAGDRLEEGRSLRALGECRVSHGDAELAEQDFLDALEVHRAAESITDEALALATLGIGYMNTGRTSEALMALAEAVAIQEVVGSEFYIAYTNGLRALALCLSGELESAIVEHERQIEVYKRLGVTRFESGARGYLGVARLLWGRDLEAAARDLAEACQSLRQAGELPSRAMFSAFAGGLAARQGNVELARELFDEAESCAAQTDVEHLPLLVALHRTHLDPSTRPEVIERACRAQGANKPPIEVDLDVRLSVFALGDDGRAALGRLGDQLGDPKHLLVVDRGAKRVTPPGAVNFIDLSMKPVLSRVLFALLDARQSESGGLQKAELAAILWPNDQLSRQTQNNRLHVSIGTLRKLGLSEVIVRRSGGYAIHPSLQVEEVGDS